MRSAAILPVKQFGAAKQRLSEMLGAATRAALAAAMFDDVLGALQGATALDVTIVVSGEPRVTDLIAGRDVVLLDDPAEKGQSQAARTGLARASALGCSVAVLIPGDCPLLEPAEVDGLIERRRGAGAPDVIVVPDRHRTGTNAVVLDPAGPFEPQFGPDSLRLHTEQCARRGLSCAVEEIGSLALDLDTPDDLAELIRALGREHGRAPLTRGALSQIEKTRLSRNAA